MRDDFRLMEASSKFHGHGIQVGKNYNRTGLSAAAVIYGTAEIRDSVLDDDDKEFARERLNSSVMNAFNYKLP